jgi:serine/threonine protein kinase
VFVANRPLNKTVEPVVLKKSLYEAEFDYEDYEYMRMDGLVGERLTSSPHIADIYGFCALSMLSEYFSNGDLESKAVPISPRGELHAGQEGYPMNNFTVTEKLHLSLEMVEAVAALHGYKDGVIVHDDIQLPQFLFTNDGRVKLNDFNRAEIMLWNDEDQEYCGYTNGRGHGSVSVPRVAASLRYDLVLL